MKFETSRLIGFSDGIFAISITLLVLQLTIPDPTEDNLPAMLRATLPALESWSLSFLVIGSLWVLHHQMIALVKVADTVLLWLNLLLLMCISLMPWTTDVVDTYRQETAGHRHFFKHAWYSGTAHALSVDIRLPRWNPDSRSCRRED